MNKIAGMSFTMLAILFLLLLINRNSLSNQVEKQKVMLKTVGAERNAALDNILLMEKQRQAVATIDIKYTKELADARSENERLRTDIASGAKRLQLNATCPKPVSKTTGPASVPDDASTRLTDSAERDYLNLRERIDISTKQIEGLQDYIINVCLKG
ncbi:lysis protein [Yersinia enterocolitica]|uniref:lysis protein n=1 Tax=Yersinia enterocolitica TaxID=630 RepID=UPI003D063D1D